MEQQNICINLCDIILSIPNVNSFIVYLNRKFDNCSNMKKRIYVGSYFCSRYFLHMKERLVKDWIPTWFDMQYAISLVIPVCTEGVLDDIKKMIDYMLRNWNICDEIVVNDYGMLMYISNNYPTIKLTMGRLFFKDARDFRIPEMYHSKRKPALLGGYLSEFEKKYKISGVEFDAISSIMDLSEVSSNLEIGVHMPYSFMTTGMICEFAAINKRISKKFIPNDYCTHQCTDSMVFFRGNHNVRHFKLGRAVYFSIDDCKIISAESYRVIYAPYDEIYQMNKEYNKI